MKEVNYYGKDLLRSVPFFLRMSKWSSLSRPEKILDFFLPMTILRLI